jgi:hypothetical protein
MSSLLKIPVIIKKKRLVIGNFNIEDSLYHYCFFISASVSLYRKGMTLRIIIKKRKIAKIKSIVSDIIRKYMRSSFV